MQAEEMSALALVDSYRSGALSPLEAVDAILARIARLEPHVNAFAYFDPDAVRKMAAESTARWARKAPLGPLDGVPVSIKDLLLTKGWPTRMGSKATRADQDWNEDAPCVARLRESGAVLLGKTTTSEFGASGFSWSPLTGYTHNPWDLTRSAGASSAGAAAALAAGFGPLAIGNDAMGSIRIPASFTGVFGLKPTYGRVPNYPTGAGGDLGSVGPMSRRVEDAALLMNLIARPDARDWTALPADDCDYVATLHGDLKGLRVALSVTMGFAEVDDEIAEAVRRSAQLLTRSGAIVAEIDPPGGDPFPTYNIIRLINRGAFLARMSPEAVAQVHPTVANISRRAQSISGIDARIAAQERDVYAAKMHRFLSEFDILLTPTMPVAALPLEQKHDDPESDEWYRVNGRMWAPFGLPFNLTQQPAASLPCGLTAAGLPIGLQIVARKYRDALVLQVAHVLQSLLRFPLLPNREFAPRSVANVSSSTQKEASHV